LFLLPLDICIDFEFGCFSPQRDKHASAAFFSVRVGPGFRGKKELAMSPSETRLNLDLLCPIAQQPNVRLKVKQFLSNMRHSLLKN